MFDVDKHRCGSGRGIGVLLVLVGCLLWAAAAAASTVVQLTGGLTPGFSANMGPNGITTGPDGSIWFTETTDPGGVARVNPNGQSPS